MKHSIALLKKELSEWQEHNDNEKEYFKGEENDPMAIKSFNECFENILDLQQAIDILEKQAKVFSSNAVLADVVKSSFHKKSFYYGTCSKCDAPFTTNDEIGQEVYPTKAELIEAMKDYDWQIKGDTALCDNCS